MSKQDIIIEDGVIVVNQIDRVGNDLTKRLRWCDTHSEPVWVYNDESFRCWWENVTGHLQHMPECGPEDHSVVDLPSLEAPDD